MAQHTALRRRGKGVHAIGQRSARVHAIGQSVKERITRFKSESVVKPMK